MCEKPKDEVPEANEPGRDKPRSYYYDDAHGYEDFDPHSDANDVDEDEESA